MIADGIRDIDLADYQRAVRTILVHPLVTETAPDGQALRLVRRFADALTRDLDDLAGYRLELAPTCARLVRRLDRLDPTQVVQPKNRKPFDRRRYAYLCLMLAALGRSGSQIVLSELADATRRRASEIDDFGFDPDEYRHRLAFIDVVHHLLELGGLRQLAGTSAEWVRDPDAGEALYDIDRDVVHLAFVPPRVVQHVASAQALLTGSVAVSRDTRRAETRQGLVRLIVEHPVVYLDDLDEAERTYLVSQARSLADDLHRLTGGQLERRAEGVALIDATGGFSDRRFPSPGTPGQAALLLADRIAGHLAIGEPATATVPLARELVAATASRLDDARPFATALLGEDDDDTQEPDAPGPDEAPRALPPDDRPTAPFLPDTWLLDQAEELCATHQRAFAADLRGDPAALLDAALGVLAAFDLIRPVPGGVVARPALARYRDLAIETAPPPPPPQSSLFDTPPETQP